MRSIEEPVTRKGEGPGKIDGETVTTHPAFVQIGASRVSGTANLYDSDFTHQHYIVLRVGHSELHRSLNRDWHFSKNDSMLDVAMTEAQWATFVSSLNVGSGVPATLQRFDHKIVPGLPAPEARSKQSQDEIKASLSAALAAIKEVGDLIDGLGLSKAKAAAVKERARVAYAKLSDSIPFAASSFDEHMEATTERAKMEVHGYMTGMIQRAGLEAIGTTMPLQLEHHAKAEG